MEHVLNKSVGNRGALRIKIWFLCTLYSINKPIFAQLFNALLNARPDPKLLFNVYVKVRIF
jgi:hypothetical protein